MEGRQEGRERQRQREVRELGERKVAGMEGGKETGREGRQVERKSN